MITVNMTKAREIKRDQLRAERKPLLEQLDVEFIKAQEQNDQVKARKIADKKKTLRDAPSNLEIHNATTPESLKKIKLQ